MPTYDYRCDACGHEMELFQSMSAVPIKKCPACGKSKLRRLIGIGAGVLFKGGGFYETDYRSEGYKKAAKSESASAAGQSASGESKAPAASSSENTAAAVSKPPSGDKSGSAPASSKTESPKPTSSKKKNTTE